MKTCGNMAKLMETSRGELLKKLDKTPGFFSVFAPQNQSAKDPKLQSPLGFGPEVCRLRCESVDVFVSDIPKEGTWNQTTKPKKIRVSFFKLSKTNS